MHVSGLALTLDVFINCSPPCVSFRQGRSLNRELVDYAGQQDLDLPVSLVPELQMHTNAYTVSGFCVWVPEI